MGYITDDNEKKEYKERSKELYELAAEEYKDRGEIKKAADLYGWAGANNYKKQTEMELIWQLTYVDQDLPWVGIGVTEYIKNGAGVEYQWNVTYPESYTPGGSEAAWYTFYPYNTGWFYDYHYSSFPKPLPASGKYHVGYNSQRFEYDNGIGDIPFTSTFMDYEYIDSTPIFTHHEYVP